MKLDQVIEALQSLKGDGAWRAVAEHSHIHYDTLARIARGDIKRPGVQTIEAIAEALAVIGPSRRAPTPATSTQEG